MASDSANYSLQQGKQNDPVQDSKKEPFSEESTQFPELESFIVPNCELLKCATRCKHVSTRRYFVPICSKTDGCLCLGGQNTFHMDHYRDSAKKFIWTLEDKDEVYSF
uniref:Uncharacterized protein n=1 Tax=Cuerna arida TaxID=1464854 RepID=A0A1B6GZJ0_9HEMI